MLTELQASGVRGRGGAGFAMGKKVSFLPKGTMDKYLVCNADESEPGTFKDRELMQKNPHLLIEGMIIAAWAAGINRSFIYIRGEYQHQADILEAAVAEARREGLLRRAHPGLRAHARPRRAGWRHAAEQYVFFFFFLPPRSSYCSSTTTPSTQTEAWSLIVPARLPAETIERVQSTAVEAFVATDCEGMARVDFFVRPDGTVVIKTS